jgi:ribosomal protein S27E
MGGIFFGAVDAMRRKRRCPKCRKEQVVPREKVRETVRCGACGADIPPPRR